MVVVGYGVLCLLVIFGVLHAVFLHLIDVYRSWVCWWIMLGVLYLLGIFSVNNVYLYIYMSTPVHISMLSTSGSASLRLFENPVGCLGE